MDNQELVDKLAQAYDDAPGGDDDLQDEFIDDTEGNEDQDPLADKDEKPEAKYTQAEIDAKIEEAKRQARLDAMEETRAQVKPKEDDFDVDALLGDMHEADRAIAKKAIEIATTRAVDVAVSRLEERFAPYLEASAGSVFVQQIKQHFEVPEGLERYVDQAAREFELKGGRLNPKQAKAVLTLAKGLQADDPERDKRRTVTSTRSVDDPQGQRVVPYRPSREDQEFERHFGKGSAVETRKSRGEL